MVKSSDRPLSPDQPNSTVDDGCATIIPSPRSIPAESIAIIMPSRRELRDHDLLSPSAYDDDVTSPRSLSEQDSDSEDDEFLRANRSPLELARHDKTVLEEEEAMEKLLVRSGPADGLRRIFSPTVGPVRIGKRNRRQRERKRSVQGKPHQEGDLMFEMEEGFRDFSDGDSIDSLDLDEKDVDDWQEQPVSGTYCLQAQC
jgi:hypothetical protein